MSGLVKSVCVRERKRDRKGNGKKMGFRRRRFLSKSSSSLSFFFPSYLAKGPRVHELDGLEVGFPGMEDLLDLDRPLEVVLELFLELK